MVGSEKKLTQKMHVVPSLNEMNFVFQDPFRAFTWTGVGHCYPAMNVLCFVNNNHFVWYFKRKAGKNYLLWHLRWQEKVHLTCCKDSCVMWSKIGCEVESHS